MKIIENVGHFVSIILQACNIYFSFNHSGTACILCLLRTTLRFTMFTVVLKIQFKTLHPTPNRVSEHLNM